MNPIDDCDMPDEERFEPNYATSETQTNTWLPDITIYSPIVHLRIRIESEEDLRIVQVVLDKIKPKK